MRGWRAGNVTTASQWPTSNAKQGAASRAADQHGSSVFSRRAREDLIDIWLHIAADDPGAADRVLDRLELAAMNLIANPRMGPARDDIRPGLRYLVSDTYLILYRIAENGVEIVRVVHGRRDLFGLF
jgi:Plasmid stabilization system protein